MDYSRFTDAYSSGHSVRLHLIIGEVQKTFSACIASARIIPVITGASIVMKWENENSGKYIDYSRKNPFHLDYLPTTPSLWDSTELEAIRSLSRLLSKEGTFFIWYEECWLQERETQLSSLQHWKEGPESSFRKPFLLWKLWVASALFLCLHPLSYGLGKGRQKTVRVCLT